MSVITTSIITPTLHAGRPGVEGVAVLIGGGLLPHLFRMMSMRELGDPPPFLDFTS